MNQSLKLSSFLLKQGRSLSTSSPAVAIVKKKAVYNDQLTELRSQWKAEHQVRIDAEEKRRKEERRLIVLQKAVRLRERNVVSAQNLIKDKERKAAAMQKYKEHIVKNNMVASDKQEVIQTQYKALYKDLQAEQKSWIDTPEKVNLLINESLFDKDVPATTGIHTRSSENWRHMSVPFNLDVMFNAHFQDRYGPANSSPEARYLEAMSNKRLQIKEMMNSMIGTGNDRQHYKEIVDKFVELYTDNDALLESSDFLDEEEEFIAEMQEESGLESDDEDKLFKYIEQEIADASGGARAQESEEEDVPDEALEDAVTDINDAEVILPKLSLDGPSRPAVSGSGKAGKGKPAVKPVVSDVDTEEKQLDMSIFDTAEENMSRDLGEDVAGTAAAAAAKKASALKTQGVGKKGASPVVKKGKK